MLNVCIVENDGDDDDVRCHLFVVSSNRTFMNGKTFKTTTQCLRLMCQLFNEFYPKSKQCTYETICVQCEQASHSQAAHILVVNNIHGLDAPKMCCKAYPDVSTILAAVLLIILFWRLFLLSNAFRWGDISCTWWWKCASSTEIATKYTITTEANELCDVPISISTSISRANPKELKWVTEKCEKRRANTMSFSQILRCSKWEKKHENVSY